LMLAKVQRLTVLLHPSVRSLSACVTPSSASKVRSGRKLMRTGDPSLTPVRPARLSAVVQWGRRRRLIAHPTECASDGTAQS
jgi:hypothetical protein